MKHQFLSCLKCKAVLKDNQITCPKCKGAYSTVTVSYGTKGIKVINKMYEKLLPFKLFKKHDFIDCPIHEFQKNLWIKDEGFNKSKSIKEKDMHIGLKVAKYLGYKKAACISGGSGIGVCEALSSKAFPITLYSPVTTHRHTQNQILTGADYEDTFRSVYSKGDPYAFNITPGINPYSQEGCKVISWQIIEAALHFDAIVIPCGNGSSLWGMYKGFNEAKECGLIEKIPKFYAAELASGPISYMMRYGKKKKNKSVLESKAVSIDVKESFCLEKAVSALKESKGYTIRVTESEIEKAFTMLRSAGKKSSYTAAAGFAAGLHLNSSLPRLKICTILTSSD